MLCSTQNMFPHRKTFSRELFDKHDDFAKVVVHSLVKQIGYEVTDITEAYGSHDFVMEREEKPYKVEVEQKMGWKTDLFPYSTLSVSHRKHTSKADLFFEVNSRGTAVAMCPMSVVLSSPVIRKNTRFGTVNEPFYDVPISKMRFFYLEDGVWMEDE
jgi:hypothetical protein